MPPIPTNLWLNHPLNQNPQIDSSASFVEYLRWLRIRRENPDNKNPQIGLVNNGEVLELLDKIEQKSNYSSRLKTLTDRTRKLATESFSVKAPWRIRVGGMRGPESMLIPAFDALGMPYIPSTTLKGVAREMAERDPNTTPEDVRNIFGDLEPTASMGKVIFLDAYPLAVENKQAGLTPDMANEIWKWQGDEPPNYKTNPNVFLSLLQPTFVIGLRKGINCSDEIIERVKKWLLQGLLQGIGSRVNSGYGELKLRPQELRNIPHEQRPIKNPVILSVPFEIKGQLIHGRQKFSGWELKNNKNHENNNWKQPGKSESELRPIAFRSMLRYWFRAFALGVLPSKRVRQLEGAIFGTIEPKAKTGLFRIEIVDVEDDQENEQAGRLILRHSGLTENNKSQRINIAQLLKNLTWMMFHLGGIGQGARRPCYQRNSNPWYRGCNLTPIRENITPNSEINIWRLPTSPDEFKTQFQSRLQEFYKYLSRIHGQELNEKNPREVIRCTSEIWSESIDINCRIVVVNKRILSTVIPNKPFALQILAEQFHNLESETETDSDAKNLCGGVNEDQYQVNGQTIRRDAIPSPVWICNLQRYQVVTVFGGTQSPRSEYLTQLQASADNYVTLWG
ncbi:RAMP superfamily CRISPR-associated protein [Anabaena azotica]|uniref:RAMP superfamily CRISPR-associated protein n=1 Tax=Anabaena azotica TaxID=197653 RepID=UPI0039A48AAB